ncbi:guanylate-binding protein 6-like [Mixophyes fleayi]|uniref:guanylate-binding protein 6-like n=1 Tax=Mixophyes fleayi TaxID=3061075 RepID=UPI003F4DEC95
MNMEAPLCLIENPESGKFQVNAEAIAILSKINQPVVVVAIVGMYRTGKSYLMNKLYGAQRGFDLGSTVQAKTKGIWMWCFPHPTLENHTLVLLDTEGLGDVEKGDTKNDMEIFCLAVLLSSAFVYNSKGVIDEDAIEKLRFVGEISELIKVKTKNNDDEEAELSRHFPMFIWVVRDITLKLELNGKEITEDEYLENALKLQESENTRKIQERNACRDCIRMYFSSRKCFVFDFPTGNKDFLQRMDEVSEEQLNPTFIEQTKTFCDYIYEKADVKYIDDIRLVTGKILGDLAHMYTDAISSSNVACMADVIVNISEAQNKAAVRDAIQYYETKMKDCVVFLTETLNQFIELSRQCENEALQIFLKIAFKDNDQVFQKDFMIKIEEKKSEFFKMNDLTSRGYCEELIRKQSEVLENALKEGVYSTPGGYQKFKEDMKLLEDKYNREPKKGTQAEEILQEFRKSKETIGITIMMNDKTLTELQKKEEENKVRKEKDEMKKKIEDLESLNKNEKLTDHIRTIEENTKQLLEKTSAERRMMDDKLTSVILQKKREQQAYVSQGFDDRARMYKAQIEDLQKERGEVKNHGWVPLVATALEGIVCILYPEIFIAGKIISGIAKLFYS